MHSLLAPILAQLLTASAGARTEVRDVFELGTQHLEGAASAGVGLNLSLPSFSLSLGYSPQVTVSPLESTPRDVTVTDTVFAGAAAGYTFRFRRASLTLSQTAGYSVQNPVLDALSGTPPAQPAPPALGGPGQTPAPPDGTEAADARRAENYRVQTWSLRSSVDFERALSRASTFEAGAAYSFAAGLGQARPTNPLVQGPDANIGVGFEVTRRDRLTTELNGQYRWSETSNHGQILLLGERWEHDFSRQTHGELGAGVSYTRQWTGNGGTLNGIYPAGIASITTTSRLSRGLLTLGAGAAAAPVLDVTSATVDPRLGVGANANWVRRKLSFNASLHTALSFATDETSPGALNSLSANVGMAYDLGAGFFFDCGVRSAWETFEGVTVVNPQSTIFVGLGWVGDVTLIETGTGR